MGVVLGLGVMMIHSLQQRPVDDVAALFGSIWQGILVVTRQSLGGYYGCFLDANYCLRIVLMQLA